MTLLKPSVITLTYQWPFVMNAVYEASFVPSLLKRSKSLLLTIKLKMRLKSLFLSKKKVFYHQSLNF